MGVGRNLLSTTAILSLAIGAFCTILLIFQETRVIDNLEYTEWYKVGAAISNILTLFFISYLILTSQGRSMSYKILLVLVLVAGLVAELVLTNIFSNLSPQYPAYLVIIFNLLLRTYLIVQLIQEPWDVMTLTSGSTVSAVPAIVKRIEKTVLPPKAERVMDDDSELFKNQFKTMYRKAREKVGATNFDDSTIGKAYKEVIDPAVAARDFSRDRLKDAAGYLKPSKLWVRNFYIHFMW